MTNYLIVSVHVAFNAFSCLLRQHTLVITIFPLMYYLSEKGCSFVVVTKSTCLKIHALAPSCLWSVCHLLSHRVTHCSLLVKQGSVLAPLIELLRELYGSEQDLMEQTWLLCNWLSCMACLLGL